MSEQQQQAAARSVFAPQKTLSLRYRFLLVVFLIFLGGAAASYSVIAWFTQDIVRTLSGWFAEKNVLYEKARVLQLLLREVVLAQKMASSPVLKAWVNAEFDPHGRARALAELEDYRTFFRSKSYFIAIARSGNYYFDDGKGGHDLHRPRYTLNQSNSKDGWFYATLGKVDDYELNVDTDRHLKVTKVWVNTVLKDKGKPLAVIGTGVDLSDFMRSVISNTQPGITNLLLDRNGAIQAHQDVSRIDFASIAKKSRNEEQNTIFNMIADLRDRRLVEGALGELSSGTRDTRTLEIPIEGENYVAGITYLPEIKWFLVTLTHPEAAENRHFVTTVAMVMVVALALALLLAGLVFDRTVLQRLAKFDDAALQLASGNYSVSLPHQGGDEIGRLGKTLQGMANRIAAHTLHLEQQVAQRTQSLERIAYADFLTGLLNRRGIIDRIAVEKNRVSRSGGRLGVIILDIDHFKQINDRHGHAAGDQALIQVANTIRNVMRSYDVCARWGGEEFLVLVPDASNRDAMAAIAEKLRDSIGSIGIEHDGNPITLTASIGCVLAEPKQSVDDMLKTADDALYAAKSGGRNRVVVAELAPQS